MFTHHKHSRSRSVGLLEDDPSSNNSSVPGSPSSFTKPGSHMTRQRNSSSGGGSTPTSTGGAASPAAVASSGGGYATRHSLSQVAAAATAVEGGTGGRSLTSSRTASVTERPSHRRSPSHGIVDAGAISSPSSTEKAR
jgi:hypothetical protein